MIIGEFNKMLWRWLGTSWRTRRVRQPLPGVIALKNKKRRCTGNDRASTSDPQPFLAAATLGRISTGGWLLMRRFGLLLTLNLPFSLFSGLLDKRYPRLQILIPIRLVVWRHFEQPLRVIPGQLQLVFRNIRLP